MRWALSSNSFAEEVLKEAEQPDIRLFQVAMEIADSPKDDVAGQWTRATRQTAGPFSAVAWFFGKLLHSELKKPVGLIQATWGGTPIVTWLPPETSAGMPEAKNWDKMYATEAGQHGEAFKTYEAKLAAWRQENNTKDLQAKNAASQPKAPREPRPQIQPSRCYNAMVNGLRPYSIRGFIWYQGESDTGSPHFYQKFFPALITSWRKGFEKEDLSFFYVELPAYSPPTASIPDGWIRLRESQEAALALPQTGVATAIDLGSKTVLHPKNKIEVGERLGRLALTETYGRPGLSKSPQFKAATVKGKEIHIQLENATGLRRRGDKITECEIKGADGHWKPAQAKLEGEEVVVWSDEIAQPTAARYAWANFTTVSIENESGLPLRPFRTNRDEPLPAPQAGIQD